MNLMPLPSVELYLWDSKLTAPFHNVMVMNPYNGEPHIPTQIIKEAIGEQAFREMECWIPTWNDAINFDDVNFDEQEDDSVYENEIDWLSQPTEYDPT